MRAYLVYRSTQMTSRVGVVTAAAMALVVCGLVASSCGGGEDASSRQQRKGGNGCPVSVPVSGPLSWSPVAAKLALAVTEPPSYEAVIHVLDVSTCELSRVTEGVGPDWSPDGQKLVFSRRGGIFVANDDGSEVEQISVVPDDQTASDGAPKWSPRGDAIAFLAYRFESDVGRSSLIVMRPDGTEQRTVATRISYPKYSTGAHFWPAWSPDGSWVAAASCSGRLGHCLVNREGHRRRIKLAGVPASYDEWAWAPDGKAIAVANRDGGFERRKVLVAPLGGGRARPLLRQPGAPTKDYGPTWANDGRSIAFIRERVENRQPYKYSTGIYIVRADGTGLRTLTEFCWEGAPAKPADC